MNRSRLLLLSLSLVVLSVVPARAEMDPFQKAKIATARVTILNLKTAIAQYMLDHNRCPKDLKVLEREKYIHDLRADPWGEGYVYRCPGAHDKEEGDISSKGPDRKLGTSDDVNSWQIK